MSSLLGGLLACSLEADMNEPYECCGMDDKIGEHGRCVSNYDSTGQGFWSQLAGAGNWLGGSFVSWELAGVVWALCTRRTPKDKSSLPDHQMQMFDLHLSHIKAPHPIAHIAFNGTSHCPPSITSWMGNDTGCDIQYHCPSCMLQPCPSEHD